VNVPRRWFLRAVAGCVSISSLSGFAQRSLASSLWPDERMAGAFYCHADFRLDEFEALWREMAELQQDLTRTLRVPAADEPIHLFLFSNKSIYKDYLQLHFPEVPFRRALYIKDRGPGMVFAYQSSDFETDVRHESTHALLHAALPVVPLWLDEGLAEYFEVAPARRAHNSPHLTRMRWGARFAQVPDIEQLEAISDLAAMGVDKYREAWSWVHFMLHGPAEAHEELVSFLATIRANSPPGKLARRLKNKMPDLNERYLDHFRNWKA
jgi:hypothetical protein